MVEHVTAAPVADARRPSGLRRAIAGLMVGAVVGLAIGLLLPHETGATGR